ncbi:AP-1 complex-associated regulatory protein, partial [Ophiophagus hannah]
MTGVALFFFFRPLTEEEISALQERQYNSIAEKQRTLDDKLQSELAIQEEKLRIEEETIYAVQRERARAAKQRKFMEQQKLQRITQKANHGDTQSSVVEEDLDSYLGNVKLPYEAFRTSSINRMIPLRERSKTEEDILRAALKFNGKKTGSNPTSTSDDSTGLEWENDFVSAEMDDNGNSEYAGFVNPVLELSSTDQKTSGLDQEVR